MTSYLVINKSSELIYLSDIGVRLERYGDSAVIPKHLFDGSAQAKGVRHMVSLRLFNSNKSFDKSQRPKVPDPQGISEDSIEEEPMQVSLLKSIDSKLDALNANISKLAEALSGFQPTAQIHSSGVQTSYVRAPSDPSPAPDPLFIPSTILPQGVETQINVRTDTSIREDISSATDVLKALRRKK